jgi:hypothetical protein
MKKAAILVIILIAVVSTPGRNAAQFLDTETRRDICSKAQALLDQRETEYAEILKGLDITKDCPRMSYTPAIELQNRIREELGDIDKSALTEMGVRLPFALVNIHNDAVALNCLKRKYRGGSAHKSLMDYYASELVRNTEIVETLCHEIVIPQSVTNAIQASAGSAARVKSIRGLINDEDFQRCFRDCEDFWKRVLDPRWNLIYLTEVVRCQRNCRR